MGKTWIWSGVERGCSTRTRTGARHRIVSSACSCIVQISGRSWPKYEANGFVPASWLSNRRPEDVILRAANLCLRACESYESVRNGLVLDLITAYISKTKSVQQNEE